jgi:hypothetical protein
MTIEAKVLIRQNSTGEIRAITHEFNDEDLELEEYRWGDGGNHTCDCVRAQLFCEANGEDDPNIECSNDKYDVKIIHPETNEILYEDDADDKWSV